MKSARLRIGFVLCVLLLIVAVFVGLRSNDKRSAKLHSPELEYLKAVNSAAPPRDPELMFILMGEFASSPSRPPFVAKTSDARDFRRSTFLCGVV